jgi:hypothetical protein
MPIRLNLLAEAHAAEELRRKDPVKRSLLVSGLLIVLVLFWISTLQIKIISSKNDLKDLGTKWNGIEQSYQVAVESKRKSIEVEGKLASLQQLKSNRFLWGTALNAFQQTLAGIDDVQVVRLRTEQSYVQNEVVKPATSDGKPAPKQMNAIEKIGMVIDAVDSSGQPGSQVNRFKEAILSVPFFQTNLQKTNGVLLTSLSAPNVGPLGRNAYVMFTLQCYFPEKVR